MNKSSGIILAIALSVIIWIGYVTGERETPITVNSFEECVAAGNPVMESYPRQCRSVEGRNFVEEINNLNQ